MHIPERINRKGEGRVIFLARKAEIAAMLEAGYPNRAIFDDCALSVAMSYSQFNRYIAQYFGQRRSRTAKPAAPATTAPATTSAATTSPAAAPVIPSPPPESPSLAKAPPAKPARELWTGDIRKLRRDLGNWPDLLDK